MRTPQILLARAFMLIVAGSVSQQTTKAAGDEIAIDISNLSNTKKEELLSWRTKWENSLTREAKKSYCRSESGEEIGWKMSPLLNGFYYGYLATGETKWVDMLVNCTDTWLNNGVVEPDGYLGWPKVGASGTSVEGLDGLYADSLLGEAMALRPIVLTAMKILSTPSLATQYGAKATAYIDVAERIFIKWDSRRAWRGTSDGGMITVVLPYGIDQRSPSAWKGEIRDAARGGVSHPNNKANLVAAWLLAMFDATRKEVYRDRAEQWFRVMKHRMLSEIGGPEQVWNYWEPAGAWDYGANGIPKHWIGVHPNPGYYMIDVDCIIDAYEHGVVFSNNDVQRLIAISNATERYWPSLARYDATTRNRIELRNKPDAWAGLAITPWYLSLEEKEDASSSIVP